MPSVAYNNGHHNPHHKSPTELDCNGTRTLRAVPIEHAAITNSSQQQQSNNHHQLTNGHHHANRREELTLLTTVSDTTSPGAGGGAHTPSALTGVSCAMRTRRDHEKLQLGELNDRFASYVSRAKFLEGQNSSLLAELAELRSAWSADSGRVRARLEPELADARAALDQGAHERCALELAAKRREHTLADLRRTQELACTESQAARARAAQLEHVLEENARELRSLRGEHADAQTSVERARAERGRLADELARLIAELDAETLARVRLDFEVQTLSEQVPFIKAVHEQECAQLRSLSDLGACGGGGAHKTDPADFYRAELERAVREIRGDFAAMSEQNRHDLEEWYKARADELAEQAATKRDALDSQHNNYNNNCNLSQMDSPASLKSSLNDTTSEYAELARIHQAGVARLDKLETQLEKTRAENAARVEQCEREAECLAAKYNDLVSDYDELLNSKASIEFEINAYRRLLESEEAHAGGEMMKKKAVAAAAAITITPTAITTTTAKTNAINSIARNFSNHLNLNLSLPASELNSKTTFQRQARGPVSIMDICLSGSYIVLENTSRSKDVTLTKWSIRREIDHARMLTYQFPDGQVLRKNSMLKVWAGHQAGREDAVRGELENREISTWGVSRSYAVTTVLNEEMTEKATHIQKTLYSS